MFERLQNKCNLFHLNVITGLKMKLLHISKESIAVQLIWSLVSPLSPVKSILQKYKTYHTFRTLPKSHRSFKLSSQASRKLFRDVPVYPAMTLIDLQGSLCEIGVSVHQSTISRSLHKDVIDGQVARKKQSLKKTHRKDRLEFAKNHLRDTARMWRKVLW